LREAELFPLVGQSLQQPTSVEGGIDQAAKISVLA
jgi:hypothetical protein